MTARKGDMKPEYYKEQAQTWLYKTTGNYIRPYKTTRGYIRTYKATHGNSIP